MSVEAIKKQAKQLMEEFGYEEVQGNARLVRRVVAPKAQVKALIRLAEKETGTTLPEKCKGLQLEIDDTWYSVEFGEKA